MKPSGLVILIGCADESKRTNLLPPVVPSSLNVQVFLSVKADDELREADDELSVALGINTVIKGSFFKGIYLWEVSHH